MSYLFGLYLTNLLKIKLDHVWLRILYTNISFQYKEIKEKCIDWKNNFYCNPFFKPVLLQKIVECMMSKLYERKKNGEFQGDNFVNKLNCKLRYWYFFLIIIFTYNQNLLKIWEDFISYHLVAFFLIVESDFKIIYD